MSHMILSVPARCYTFTQLKNLKRSGSIHRANDKSTANNVQDTHLFLTKLSESSEGDRAVQA